MSTDVKAMLQAIYAAVVERVELRLVLHEAVLLGAPLSAV